jgi:hypothetical protein
MYEIPLEVQRQILVFERTRLGWVSREVKLPRRPYMSSGFLAMTVKIIVWVFEIEYWKLFGFWVLSFVIFGLGLAVFLT